MSYFSGGFRMRGMPLVETRDLSEKGCLELYLDLLLCGTQHTNDEIERATTMLDEMESGNG